MAISQWPRPASPYWRTGRRSGRSRRSNRFPSIRIRKSAEWRRGDFPRCEGSKHAGLSSSHSNAERPLRTVVLEQAEVPGRPSLGGSFFTRSTTPKWTFPHQSPYGRGESGTDLAANRAHLRIRCADSSRGTAGRKPAAGGADCLVTVFPGKRGGFQEKATYAHNGVASDAGEMAAFRPETARFGAFGAVCRSLLRGISSVGLRRPDRGRIHVLAVRWSGTSIRRRIRRTSGPATNSRVFLTEGRPNADASPRRGTARILSVFSAASAKSSPRTNVLALTVSAPPTEYPARHGGYEPTR